MFTLLTYSLLKNIALICSCSPHSLHFATICNVLLVRNSIKSESDWKLMIDFSLRCKFEVDPFNSRIFLANFLIFRQSSACLYEWVFLSACSSICSSYLEVQECVCGSHILYVCSFSGIEVWVRPPHYLLGPVMAHFLQGHVVIFSCNEQLKKWRCHSVCPSVRPSVCPFFSFSVLGILSSVKLFQCCVKHVSSKL